MRVNFRQKLSDKRTRPLFLLTLGALAYTLWVALVLLTTPSDQAGVFFGREIIVKQAPDDSPLLVDDVILRIEGWDVATDLLRPGVWQQRLRAAPQPLTYTVLRDEATLEVVVPWRHYTPLQLLWRGGGLWVFGLSMLATALVLIVGRGDELSARLMACAFTLIGLVQINNNLLAAGANSSLMWAWFFIPLDAAGVCLGLSLGVHALLLFPEPKAWVERHPRWPWCLHPLTPGLALAAALLWGGSTVLRARAVFFDVANPLALLLLAAQVGAITHSYITTQRPGVRNQIRWLMWGLAVFCVPWAIFYVLPVMLVGNPWLPLSVTNLAMILLPLSFIFSIFRYGLMDIDMIINRTLVYSVFGGLLALIYLAAVSAAGYALTYFSGASNDFLAGGIATLVLFSVFNPLRLYIQRGVDRVFFREQLDLTQILRENGRKLSTTIALSDIQTLLNEDVPQQLGLHFAAVLLTDEGGDYQGQILNSPFTLAEAQLNSWLPTHREPLIVYQAHSYPEALRPALERLAEAGVEICLGLFHHHNLLGYYLFGSKRSGNLLSRDAVNALVLLGQQAAAAIENARLYAALQEYNRMLEARVAARTTELQSERNRLDTILQNIADGLVVTDRKGCIVLVNPAFARIVKFPAEQMLGNALRQIVAAEEICQLIQSALRHPGTVFFGNISGDLIGTRGDAGQTYKVSAGALLQQQSLTLEPGEMRDSAEQEVLGVVTVLRDITQEQAVDRMKTDFISTVSHELRTPLTSVLGFTKLIQKTFERDIVPRVQNDRSGQRTAERIQSNLEIITSEGERLTRLINDVLDIAKMEAGKVDWELRPTPFAEIIETAVHATSALALHKGLLVEIAVAELPTAVVDRDRMVQVLTNLLSNAIKFTESGQITVRARHIHSLAESTIAASGSNLSGLHNTGNSAGWLWVSVLDTGKGIRAERLGEVFEKFKQVSDSAAERSQGTGLGLPICREIVEHHQGRIWVESQPGIGSTFSFVLPLPAETAAPASTASRLSPSDLLPSTPPIGRRILIVDDDAHIRQLLRQELTDAGYEVIEAMDGMKALDMARTEAPDLILLDIMIPHITGFDVISVLKGSPETAALPIILLSALEDRQRGFRLGADGYLSKPLDVPLLLETIETVLRRQASPPQSPAA